MKWSSMAVYLLLVAMCSLAAGCAVSCARQDEAWGRMLESGVLRVGMDASFPPFEYITADGTLAGFDVALARELGRRLDVEVEFIPNLPYDGLYDALAVGRVDAIISALVVSPERMADFAYSTSYFDAGQVLVVQSGRAGVRGMADLKGMSVAVEFGSAGDQEARKWARRLTGLVILQCETPAEALTAVAAGQVDAALVDHVSALEEIGAGGNLTVVRKPVVAEPYAVAVRRASRRLLREIDDALAEMEEDGTLSRLREEWLNGKP